MSWLTLDMLAKARGDGLTQGMQSLLEQAGGAAPEAVASLSDHSKIHAGVAGSLPTSHVEKADMTNVTLFPKRPESGLRPARKTEKEVI